MVNDVKVKESVNRDQTFSVSATLNMNTLKITSLSIGSAYTASDAIDFYSSNATSISNFTFSHWSRSGSWGNTSSIDDVSITYSEARESVESFVVNYTYDGNVIASENIGVAGLYTGDSYTVPFRMYVEKEGALYKTSNNTSGSYYRDVVTLTTNTVVNKTLSIVDLAGGSIVLFEDLDDTDAENASVRASYGLAYNNKAYTSSVTLTPGIYTFIVKAQNKGRGSSIAVGSTTVTTIDNIGSKGSWIDKTITDVEIPEAGNVTLVKGGNNTIDCYDIIIAIRTGDITVPATITAAGWATLYTNCPLDFSGVEGLTAYTATLDGSTVTLTEVADVPANTGVVLKGEANTYEIPAIASSETAKGDLEGSATAINVEEDTENVYYVLAKSGDDDARFAKVTSGTIAAGKAYLKVAKGAAGVRESYSIGGVAPTAIESVQALQENGELFNLNGQRVTAPQKGLYIVNGKKVIMK